MPKLDAQIDELYRLPLDQFTPARNALAKTLSGEAKRQVAALRKPPLPIWAVNQLYWQEPATYKAFIDAAEKLRAAHRAVLGGKKPDLRKADELHRGTVERGVAKILGLIKGKGLPLSEAAITSIRRTLAALPDGDHPGRLTREPEPAGFSLLSGVPIKARPVEEIAPPRPSLQKAKAEQQKKKREEDAKQRLELKARQALENARREEIRAGNRLKAAQQRLADLERK